MTKAKRVHVKLVDIIIEMTDEATRNPEITVSTGKSRIIILNKADGR